MATWKANGGPNCGDWQPGRARSNRHADPNTPQISEGIERHAPTTTTPLPTELFLASRRGPSLAPEHDVARGDFIEVTIEELDRCMAAGKWPLQDESSE
jgi:hypothetical protein